MIKLYSMPSCPYCAYVARQIQAEEARGTHRFQTIDIGSHVRRLREFLALRDHDPAFAEARRTGDVGIPAYVLDDGTVTLSSRDAGLEPMPDPDEGGAAPSCPTDGTGC